ncbi:MAG: DUF4956 domain-containing protein [Bacteroidetes bacterium GWF2_33_38]|nr:MAG: DUF4956 domain-containing protein [Bacteroidetes bacterium GWF2_33_38]OFY75029.1 MAG: DUF4956 domain-containing protein [Bacteroidetes bacterium RIFOXYA12_FULL_33_9]OFY88084.1 MAG: DUF4956 domain-containing protein [Bacteroidetes bacterium RIFOXYA2_FULL_33_7]
MDLVNSEDFIKLVLRFSFNFLVTFIIVRVLYYSVAKRKDYLFTYILISTTVFLLCFLLDNVKLQLGFALGLFAIFGIIRYRTDTMPIKEMTYLFIIIGVSVINALANKKISISEIVFTNAAIIAITWILEKVWLLNHESSREIIYEKIDLIVPEKRNELIADLEKRIGQKVSRIQIGKINFLKDTAKINVFFYEKNTVMNSTDRATIQEDDD